MHCFNMLQILICERSNIGTGSFVLNIFRVNINKDIYFEKKIKMKKNILLTVDHFFAKMKIDSPLFQFLE